MSFFSKTPALSILLFTLLTGPARAQYTVCNNVGENAVAGAVIGGLLGAIIGGPRHAVGDGLIGAAAGATVSASLSCHDQGVYAQTIGVQMVRTDNYWLPLETPTTRFALLQQGYDADGRLCRTFHSEFLTPGGWIGEEQTACRGWDGVWMAGYNPGFIYATVSWHRAYPQPWWQQRVPCYGPRPYFAEYNRAPVFSGRIQVDIWAHEGRQPGPQYHQVMGQGGRAGLPSGENAGRFPQPQKQPERQLERQPEKQRFIAAKSNPPPPREDAQFDQNPKQKQGGGGENHRKNENHIQKISQ